MEVFRLRAKIDTLERQLETQCEISANLNEAYQELVKRNEDRFDDLFNQHNKIIDQKLMLTRPVPPSDGPKEKPVRTQREPWARVAARAEAADRSDYWEKKAAAVDARTLETKVDAPNTDKK